MASYYSLLRKTKKQEHCLCYNNTLQTVILSLDCMGTLSCRWYSFLVPLFDYNN